MKVLKLPVKISLVFFPEVFAVLVEAVAEAEVEAAVGVVVAVEKGYVLSWLKTFQYPRFVVRQPLQVAGSPPNRTFLLNLIPFHPVPPT